MVGINVRLLLLMQYRNTLLLCSHLREKKRRRHWVRPLWKKRKEQGMFHNLVQEMRLFNQFIFFKCFRMSATTFDKLLTFVLPLNHQDQNELYGSTASFNENLG